MKSGVLRALMVGSLGGSFVLGGCTAVKVKRLSPCEVERVGDLHGVVYYEPEPFLRIVMTPKIKKKTEAQQVTLDDGQVQMVDIEVPVEGYDIKADIVYLPNKKKPYAINSDTTGAQNKLNITLKDGWMLVSVDGTSDPQIDEGLKSVAEVIGSVLSPGDGIVRGQDSLEAKVYLVSISLDEHGDIDFGEAEPLTLKLE